MAGPGALARRSAAGTSARTRAEIFGACAAPPLARSAVVSSLTPLARSAAVLLDNDNCE
jgi:hypothetical protein